MTESPKPLSPSVGGQDGSIARQRSPSLATQFQQQQFGRHTADRPAPAGMSTSTHSSEIPVAQRSLVPGFSADGRYTSAHGAAVAAQAAQASNATSAGGAATQPATSSQNGGSGDSASNNLFATDQGMWAYIQNLEESIRDLANRVNTLEHTEKIQAEKIISLEGELTTLHHQLGAKQDNPETLG
jgi:hypothetical protein